MNILIVSPIFPLPLRSGGHTRLYNIIKRISSHHVIDFISPITDEEKDYIAELKNFCRKVVSVDISDFTSSKRRDQSGTRDLYRLFYALSGLLRNIPREVSGFYFPELQTELENLLKLHHYDIVQVEFTRMAQYFSKSFFKYHPSIKILTDYDLAFIPPFRRWQCEKNIILKIIRYMDYRITKSHALRTWKLFDSFIVMSEIDRKRTLAYLPELPVHVVPNGVDPPSYKPAPRSGKVDACRILLFIGGALHYPNIDALSFFTKEIYPLIQNQIKDSSLIIIGTGWERYSEQWAHIPSIRFTGFVKDIRPYARASTVLIAPIRIGGGTRLKILEAMAMGIPVVSTSIGCEGIDVEDGRDILIADTPEDFAAKVSELFSNLDLRDRITENAYHLVKESYDWDKLASKMERIYEDLTRSRHD